jgi:hypothetical protein
LEINWEQEEQMNRQQNEDEHDEKIVEGSDAGNSKIVKRCRSQWRGVECDLLDDDGIFIAKGQVIECDPMEAIVDDHLGEDHVGLCILYCFSTMSIIMTIWKWPLFYFFFYGLFFAKTFHHT